MVNCLETDLLCPGDSESERVGDKLPRWGRRRAGVKRDRSSATQCVILEISAAHLALCLQPPVEKVFKGKQDKKTPKNSLTEGVTTNLVIQSGINSPFDITRSCCVSQLVTVM